MLQFHQQGLVGWLADMLILPIMYLLQGNFSEVPQRTHLWNNHKFKSETELLIIRALPKIHFEGEPSARQRRLGFIPIFHMPAFGGWKKFVVLTPDDTSEPWFIGWLPTDGEQAGISRIPLTGPVRMTIGDGPVSFFALSESGVPLQLIKIGEGYIGKAGEFAHVPLR